MIDINQFEKQAGKKKTRKHTHSEKETKLDKSVKRSKSQVAAKSGKKKLNVLPNKLIKI